MSQNYGALERVLRMGEGRRLKRLADQAAYIAELEPDFERLSDEELAGKTVEFRERLENGEELDELVFEAFAAVREAAITYGTNSEFGFDYLRDNMATSLEATVQRGHTYGIVDEVDSILIDEARTPLIISGEPETAARTYYDFARIAKQLTGVQAKF